MEAAKILELNTSMYNDLNAGQEQLRAEMKEGLGAVNQKLTSLDKRLTFVAKSVIKIKNDHGVKVCRVRTRYYRLLVSQGQ